MQRTPARDSKLYGVAETCVNKAVNGKAQTFDRWGMQQYINTFPLSQQLVFVISPSKRAVSAAMGAKHAARAEEERKAELLYAPHQASLLQSRAKAARAQAAIEGARPTVGGSAHARGRSRGGSSMAGSVDEGGSEDDGSDAGLDIAIKQGLDVRRIYPIMPDALFCKHGFYTVKLNADDICGHPEDRLDPVEVES
jgi:hypothetical protein